MYVDSHQRPLPLHKDERKYHSSLLLYCFYFSIIGTLDRATLSTCSRTAPLLLTEDIFVADILLMCLTPTSIQPPLGPIFLCGHIQVPAVPPVLEVGFVEHTRHSFDYDGSVTISPYCLSLLCSSMTLCVVFLTGRCRGCIAWVWSLAAWS